MCSCEAGSGKGWPEGWTRRWHWHGNVSLPLRILLLPRRPLLQGREEYVGHFLHTVPNSTYIRKKKLVKENSARNLVAVVNFC